MARFAISRGMFGTCGTVILEDTGGGSRAVFARLGATLLGFHIPLGSELFDVTDGFATPEELAQARGGRAWIMAPFSNRIDDGKYEFGGRLHDLGLEDPKKRVILHGFVKRILCDVAAEQADDAAAPLSLERRGAPAACVNGVRP